MIAFGLVINEIARGDKRDRVSVRRPNAALVACTTARAAFERVDGDRPAAARAWCAWAEVDSRPPPGIMPMMRAWCGLVLPLGVGLAGCAALLGADFDRAGADSTLRDGSVGGGDGSRAADGAPLSPDAAPVRPDDAGNCPTGRKLCGGDCVSLNDPAFGCDVAACEPCAAPYATATCAAGACALASCAAGHADCDGVVGTGCEVDVTSAHDHCGDCHTVCGATQVCNQRACADSCGAGRTACAGSCVTLTEPEHCGSCSHACPGTTHGAAGCNGGACTLACDSGYHLCGAQCASNDGVATCGGGCQPCTAPTHGTATCDGVACGFRCDSGYQPQGTSCVPLVSACIPAGSSTPCTHGDADCCSLICFGQMCLCFATGQSCTANVNCCSGSCNGSGACD